MVVISFIGAEGWRALERATGLLERYAGATEVERGVVGNGMETAAFG